MVSRSQRSFVLFLAVAIAQGCVTVHAPLIPDDEFPRAWGKLSALGPECKALEGTYLNGGIAAGFSGSDQSISLTSVLNLRSSARTLSLSVRTRRLDQNGDAFSTLKVVIDGNIANAHELEGCFCIKQTLACTQINEKYWAIPYLGLGGSQRNVYFSLSNDGSLIAKLQNYRADVVLLIPVFEMKEPWVRFAKEGNSDSQ